MLKRRHYLILFGLVGINSISPIPPVREDFCVDSSYQSGQVVKKDITFEQISKIADTPHNYLALLPYDVKKELAKYINIEITKYINKDEQNQSKPSEWLYTNGCRWPGDMP